MEKTVFILGAGASTSYGFPLGKQLIREIYEIIRTTKHRDKTNNLVSLLGPLKNTNVNEFADALFHAAPASIDTFLAQRNEFDNIGKLMIAYVLMQYEYHANLFSYDIKEDWYRYLWHQLYRDFDLEYGFNSKIGFVTFNYDRSLDFFFYKVLMESFYSKNIDRLSSSISHFIPIKHIYGSLGCLPYQTGFQREYANSFTSLGGIREIASQLRTYHERQEEGHYIDLLYNQLDDCNRVFFLGFGYHEINLNILTKFLPKENCSYYGTALGLSSRESKYIETLFNDRHINIELKDCTCLELLKERF